MIDPQLIGYIKDCLSKNIPVEQIKKSLTEKGWSDFDVNEAISLATQQAPRMNTTNSILPQQSKVMPAETKTGIKLSKNLLFIFIGVFIFLIVAIGVFFLIMNSSGNLSETKLSQGAYVILGEGKEVKFTLNETKHTATINSISGNSVGITIQSNPITATLTIGETKKFDFNNDAIYDFSVKLNNITDNKANLYFKKISETCSEEWDCTEWSNCTDGNQTRTCEDLNNCGTQEDKPSLIQECEVLPLSCSEQEGYLCSATETCNGTITNSSDGDCCLGECVLEEVDVIACGTDITCFIQEAGNCSLSNMTYNSSFVNSTWRQNDSYYFKIRGLESEKCVLYQELLDVAGIFTDSERESLNSSGKSEEEIDQMEEEQNNALRESIGHTEICSYSITNLVEKLNELEDEGSFNLSTDEIEQYECSGTLFG